MPSKFSLRTVATALAVVVVVASGCATAGSTVNSKLPSGGPYWPEPPLMARVAYEQTLVSAESLGIEKTFSQSLFSLLTGTPPPRQHVYQPMDIVVSDDGKRLYVSDFGQLLVFMFDFENKTVTPIQPGERAFGRPHGLALDADENLYVVEQANAQITVLDREQNVIGMYTDPSLVRPADIAIDRERGRFYVADPARVFSETHSVKSFSLDGTFLGEVGNGRGTCEGCLLFPTYVEVDDATGNLYVTSTLKACVDVFDADGNFVSQLGERGKNFGMFDKPKGVAIDTFGNAYVVDSGWSNVQIFNPKGEVLLYFGGRGSSPGLMHNPTGIAIDKNNRIYVADFLGNKVIAYQLVNTTAADSFIDPATLDQEDAQQVIAPDLESETQQDTTSTSPDRRGQPTQGAQR